MYFAAQKGWKTLGIDQFGPAHNRGSSHGQSRMIRTAYFEHENYVPLAQRAFQMWDEIQKRTTESLIRRTGLLQVGDPNGSVVKGVLKSVDTHQLPIEHLDPTQIQARFPLLKPDSTHLGLLEKEAGFLRVEKCIATMIKLAKDAGAEYLANTRIQKWHANDDGSFTVNAGDQTLTTKRLMVTAGPWAQELLGDLNLEIRIRCKHQFWFQSDRIDGHVENGFPCFLMETDKQDWFYGVPAIDRLGMKIAEHTGGTEVPSVAQQQRESDEQDLARVQGFVDKYFDFGRSRVIYHSPCMYSVSADEHFIIDQHPNHEQVAFAAGMSGHGFKFAPVIGQYLVNLLDGQSDSQMEFLKLDRLMNSA